MNNRCKNLGITSGWKFSRPTTLRIFSFLRPLSVILLTWRIWWAPNNASRWHMGYDSAFKGLKPEWAAVIFWRNKHPCLSRAQNYGLPTLRDVSLLPEVSTWCAGTNIWLYGANLGNENLKTATPSADYDRSKTTVECGIIQLFG